MYKSSVIKPFDNKDALKRCTINGIIEKVCFIMLTSYQIAKQILKNVGGISNFEYCRSCASRLKVYVKCRTFVNYEGIENTSGIVGVFYDSSGIIQLIIKGFRPVEIATQLNKIVSYEQYPNEQLPAVVQSQVKQKSALTECYVNKFCPICNNRLCENGYCITCKKFIFPTQNQRNTTSVSRPHTDNYGMPININNCNEQSNPVIINNFNIYIGNLNINGLTFNQIIQYNGGNQQTIGSITDRVTLFTNFVTYITQRDQKNDEMASDVIVILKVYSDTDVRMLGYSMQQESRVGRNPLAKLRRWILQHKDDVDMAKKFFDALSSAASFAQKWGPWLAKVVGL